MARPVPKWGRIIACDAVPILDNARHAHFPCGIQEKNAANL
jgi:hypothetical protein